MEGTFQLEIALGNDAMSTPQDIAAALQRAAGYVERAGETGGPITGSIRDDNGNTIGTFWTEEI